MLTFKINVSLVQFLEIKKCRIISPIFDGSSIKIICEPDSFAEQLAQQNGLDYELTNGGEEVVIEDESFEPDEPQTAKASTHGGVSLTSLAIIGVVSGVIIMAVIAIIIAKNNRKNPKA